MAVCAWCLDGLYSNEVCMGIHPRNASWWWRHDMETSFPLLAFCGGIHRSVVDYPHIGPVMRSFDVSINVSLINMHNKQSSFQRFETLWRLCDAGVILPLIFVTATFGTPNLFRWLRTRSDSLLLMCFSLSMSYVYFHLKKLKLYVLR